MKLTILQEDLAKAITQASRFVSTRSQLPILGNILLRATKTKLNISSTNLETSILIKTGAKIEEEGEISIPSKVITEIVNNLPKDQIILESEKEQLKIKSPNFNSSVLGINASDFPKIPASVSDSILLPKKEILESLSQITFATSVDETRPILTGVLFVFDKKELTLVSTDGFRLSKKKINLEKSVTKQLKTIVPKSVLLELGRLSEDIETIEMEIQEKEKQIIFGLGDIVLSSRLLEGDYPDFERIIPKESLISVRLDKEEFLRAVKLASVFARDSANIVKIKLLKDLVKISAESNSSGNQENQIEAKIEGKTDNFEIAFNFRFLEEFIHSVIGEEIEIKFITSDKAGVFTDSTKKECLHLIMPVRVNV